MTQPILAAVDPRRCDQGALALASLLASVTGVRLTVVGIYPADPLDPGGGELERVLRDDALAALRRCMGGLPDAVAQAVPSESPGRGLHETAEDMQAGLLVIGSPHHAPPGRLGMSGVAERVLHGAPCPVAIAPRGYEPPRTGLRRVGAAFVDTPEGRDALDGAAAIAARAGAALEAITVVQWFDPMGMVDPPAELVEHEREQATELAREAARRALERTSVRVDAEAVVLPGEGAAMLVERSERLDLLVCGSRGYGPLRAVLLGSVSRALAHHGRCPLIVVARGTERSLEALAGGR
jgi:nucleotide-binding universal stress UspA family protein